jgi:hypothetical protein
MEGGVSLILSLTDVSGDGVRLCYDTEGNPFSVPSAKQLFTDRRSINSRHREESETARHRTLIERTAQTRPRVPPCETRATRLSRSATRCDLSAAPIEGPGERQATMHEFREDKRDIYKIQLFLDRKNREMRHLEKQQRREEQELAAAIQQISGVDETYKKRQTMVEAAVAQHRRAADTASRKRHESESLYRTALQDTERLRADIYRNEEEVATMRLYKKFLQRFIPGNGAVREYFHNPRVLVEELHRIEKVNLSLIQHCKHIDSLLQGSRDKFNDGLRRTDATEKVGMDLLLAL